MKKLLLNMFAVTVLMLIVNVQASGQGTYNICSITQTMDSTGTLYDTGGPTGQYQVNENCTLLINPPCATSITLTFQQFQTESGFDYFYVYDGPTVASPQRLAANGSTIPPAVTCTSGVMLIVWRSDVSIVFDGFACTWTSVIAPSGAPTAAMGISNPTPPLAVDVQFNDQSAGGPVAWKWYFGDGDSSSAQNPMHAYSAPGTYTVTLIAYTCSASDTITSTVTVQAAPQISVSPTGLTANAMCGDIVNFNLDVSNLGGGQLVYNTNGAINQTVNVLALTYGVDLFSEYPNTIAAINQHFTNYNLTSTGTTSPGVLQGLLVGKNVLLIPEQELGDQSVWNNLYPVIRQYLNNGGSVIWCGSYSSQADFMLNSGVFTGRFVMDDVSRTLQVLEPTHPLAAGMTPTFTGPSATYSDSITNGDKVRVVGYLGRDIVTTRLHGAGKAIFLAFDYYARNVNSERAIANAISWGGENGTASWISLSRNNDTVSAPSTSTIIVTFQTTGLAAGTYISSIGIASNDPNNPVVQVPCTLTVTGDPIVALSDTCLDFGTIMQHTTASSTFDIINNGCDTLHINSLVPGSVQYTVSPANGFVLPGGFQTATVNFSSSTVGTFNALIQVNNNDIDTTVCVTGTTFPAPAIATNPANGVFQSLPACGASGTSTFVIENTGGSDLTYTLGSLPAWVTANPTSGTITPGNNETITLTFNSGSMPGNVYTANMIISSNDPLSISRVYPINLTVGNNPCISYTFTTNTCTGQANFTSSSINTPTSYAWDFGGTGTSQDPNPTHFFPANGTYTVTLIACNGSGCDTMTQSVQAIITGPQATSCYPATLAYCCQIGLTNVRVGNINKTTFDAVEGYKDYTCTDTTTLARGSVYSFQATTGVIYQESVRAWIDWNNDGVLDPVNEVIFADSAVLTNHSGFFTVPLTAAIHQPLRLRVSSDFSGNPSPEPCLDLQFGQVEDYSIFVTYGVGVAEVESNVPMSVYPNPFTRDARIDYHLNTASKVSLEVYNVIGEKVQLFFSEQTQSAGTHSYNFENAESGVYFVKLTVDGKSKLQKIIKM